MNRFKPGDKARIIGDESLHNLENGSRVQIIEYIPQKGTFKEHYIVTAFGWRIAFPCDLEPIEPVQEEESPWISVEDRLPEINAQDNLALEMGESKPCLVWVNRFGVRFATHYDKGGFKAWSVGGITGLDNKEITHWMPLPKPPISRLKSEIEELKKNTNV